MIFNAIEFISEKHYYIKEKTKKINQAEMFLIFEQIQITLFSDMTKCGKVQVKYFCKALYQPR